MSLETILEKNTAALEKHSSIMEQLLARLAAGVPASLAPAVQEVVAAAPKPAPAPEDASGTTTAKAPAADAPTKTAAASSPAAAPAATAQQGSTAAAEQLTYEQVKPWVTKLSADKGREVALGALGEFGATRGPELKPEQYAGFVARAKELLA